jgi:hypothetical protein
MPINAGAIARINHPAKVFACGADLTGWAVAVQDFSGDNLFDTRQKFPFRDILPCVSAA